MSKYTKGSKEKYQSMVDNFSTEEMDFHKEPVKKRTFIDDDKYDRIYSEAWFSMRNLKDFIKANEPQKLAEVEKLMDKLQEIDCYMVYGDTF